MNEPAQEFIAMRQSHRRTPACFTAIEAPYNALRPPFHDRANGASTSLKSRPNVAVFPEGKRSIIFQTPENARVRNNLMTIMAANDADTSTGSSQCPQREFHSFAWRDFRINYRVDGPDDGPHVLLVHGFGASIQHWRKNWPALVDAGCRVFAIDCLGFGASSKPNLGIGGYSLELWRDLCIDFMAEFGTHDAKFVLVGNSIGSLVALMTAAAAPSRVRGLCLINCAGGLVSFRKEELIPLLWFLYSLFTTLLFNRFVGPAVFRRFRTRSNVRSAAVQAYGASADAVDEELVDILCEPAMDEGATEVFLAILNGPPGPMPEELLMATRWCPTLVLWGSDDVFTPLRKGFHPGIRFPDFNPNLVLEELEDAGHCPHDSRPGWVNARMVPFAVDPNSVAPVSKAANECFATSSSESPLVVNKDTFA